MAQGHTVRKVQGRAHPRSVCPPHTPLSASHCLGAQAGVRDRKVKEQREKNGLEDSESPQTERGITVPTPAREPGCGSSPGNSRSLIV